MGGKTKKALAAFCAFIFLLAPFNWSLFLLDLAKSESDFLEITEDTIWRKGDEIQYNQVFVDEGATLTIEAGTQIEVGLFIVFWRKVESLGTAKDPVVFGANNTSFLMYFQNYDIRNEEASFFRYTEFRNGGYWNSGSLAKNDYWQKSLASHEDGMAAINFMNGQAVFENCTFSDAAYADFDVSIEIKHDEVKADRTDYLKIINSNFEKSDDETMALRGTVYCEYAHTEDCEGRVFLVNNWYGDESGPDYEGIQGEGKRIGGNYSLLGFRTKELIADPVVIIPGITGSQKKRKTQDEWILDPLLHAYDDLVESLEKNGYEKNVNLFEFPYDWRESNKKTAKTLKQKIKKILDETVFSKVDLVAHSMGGLVARKYVEDGYGEYVDQMITLGTPHRGSPKAYLQWEAGEGFLSAGDYLAKHHFKQEAKHNGYDSIFEYIRAKIPSVQELLPDYDYLFDVSEGKMRKYPVDYPRNEFLEDLNSSDNAEKLNLIDILNVIGINNIENTIARTRVVNKKNNDLWEYGQPENFYNLETDRGVEYDYGDETVPEFSAKGLSLGEEFEIESSHSELPTEAQCVIFEKLTGEDECDFVDKWKFPNFLYFNLFSPVDMQVIDSEGRRVGKDFETGEILEEIPGSYYSGYDTDDEFVTIPDFDDSDYQIILKGTGSGEYTLEISGFEDGIETFKSFTDEIQDGETQELLVNPRQDLTEGEGDTDDSMNDDVAEDVSDNEEDDNDSNESSKDDEKNFLDDESQSFIFVGMNESKNKKGDFKVGNNFLEKDNFKEVNRDEGLNEKEIVWGMFVFSLILFFVGMGFFFLLKKLKGK